MTPPVEGTVLVIDDDADTREVLERFLHRKGFHVECASNGQEGLRLARQLHPAAITLDVMMPGMDGWAVLSALKSQPEVADIPVVMLTIVDDKNLGYGLGATDYMIKPVDRERLAEILMKFRDVPPPRRALVIDDEEPARQMLTRILNNLKNVYMGARNFRKALEVVDLICAIYPRSPEDVKQRALLRYNIGQMRGAIDDLEDYLKMSPDASDTDEIRYLALSLRRSMAKMN